MITPEIIKSNLVKNQSLLINYQRLLAQKKIKDDHLEIQIVETRQLITEINEAEETALLKKMAQ
jgi:hypothetical protein